MANIEHMEIFFRGGEEWNTWRLQKPLINPDLSDLDFMDQFASAEEIYRFNFFRTNLAGCVLPNLNFNKAMLREANLSDTDLSGSDFRSANLKMANLSYANLCGADFSRADLTDAVLEGATLGLALIDIPVEDEDIFALKHTSFDAATLKGANLRRVCIQKNHNVDEAILNTRKYNEEINLTDDDENATKPIDKKYEDTLIIGVFKNVVVFRGASFIDADLTEANMEDAILSSMDLGVDFSRSTLHDAKLSRAEITNAKLWQARTAEWHIDGVKCFLAYWDKDGQEAAEYGGGEFERLFAVKQRIVLPYPGGMSSVDLLMLPLIVERLQTKHPGSKLIIRSVQEDAGGASVTITVEDLENRNADAFASEVEIIRGELTFYQERLRREERLRLDAEAMYKAMVRDVLPRLLENRGQGATYVQGDYFNIPGQVAAVGRGAHAHDNTLQQTQGGIDLPKLAEELGRLRAAMKREAEGPPEQNEAIGAVAAARKAATAGDGAGALRSLKAAGKWGLDIAVKIGTPVAAEALKRVLLPGG